MRYFLIALLIILSVIFYVWQNIEVTKINLEYRKLLRVEKKEIKKVDKLKYRIEQYRTIETLEQQARNRGYRPVKPGDLDVIQTERDDKNR